MPALITGWGKCLPPAVLTNDDLATIMDTSDEWIATRTGIRARRISHVGVAELGYETIGISQSFVASPAFGTDTGFGRFFVDDHLIEKLG